jgi:ATP-dependent RNA helicase SUPV3L1/SUV3
MKGTRRLNLNESAEISARDTFRQLLLEQTRYLGNRLRSGDPSAAAWGLQDKDELEHQLETFKSRLHKCADTAERGITNQDGNPLFFRLRHAFLKGSVKGLATELKYALLDSVVTSRLPIASTKNQKSLADLRHPIEWYPATRAMHRTVHLHVGPTNSGKTYHALKRLEAAESGIYAGPLRLLAHEVYTRLNAMGKKCALVTGEERRIPEDMGPTMNSCTVEMVPLNATVDVAVIDEIQMMGDSERGWAWTQAFLGVKAKEVHLCGEVRTVDLVTELCKHMGDKLVVHRYERLSPLETEGKSLHHDLSKLQKGDAVILFSRMGIHAMKSAIEAKTKRRCAVVYGSLPPETRAQQAALFNDPDNDYDFLVASDAVGMGLNLSIKRVIFESTAKHDGTGFRQIAISEIKQIAGRAGRYKTAHEAVKAGVDGVTTSLLDISTATEPNKGLVTTLDRQDLPIVRQALREEVEPLKTAGIFPPSDTLIRFASYFPADTPFSYIVLRLHDLAVLHSSFQMCRLKEQLEVADLIQPFKLTIFDRITFTAAPVSLREEGFHGILQEFASCVADQSGGELLDLKTLNLDLLVEDIHDHHAGSKGYLREAETLHKALTLYLWLSYRFPGVFRSQALAFHVKGLVEEKIDQCLGELQWDEKKMKRANLLKRKAAQDYQVRAGIAADELVEDQEKPVPAVDDLTVSETDEVVDEEEDAHDSEDSPSSEAYVPAPLDSSLDSGEGGIIIEEDVNEISNVSKTLKDIPTPKADGPVPLEDQNGRAKQEIAGI